MKKYYLIMAYCFLYCIHFNIQGMERFSETIITFGGNSDYFGYGFALGSVVLYKKMNSDMYYNKEVWDYKQPTQLLHDPMFMRSTFFFLTELALFMGFQYWYYKNSPPKNVRQTCVRTLGDLIALYQLVWTGILIEGYFQQQR